MRLDTSKAHSTDLRREFRRELLAGCAFAALEEYLCGASVRSWNTQARMLSGASDTLSHQYLLWTA